MTSLIRKQAILFFASAVAAFGQANERQGPFRPQSFPISYEAVSMFGVDTSKGIVNVHYRIAQSFFIFIRDEAETRLDEYRARGELLIELLNEQNVSAAREIRQIVLKRAFLPRESEQLPDVRGAMSFHVPPGTYKIVFSLDDRSSGRSFLEREKKITVSNPRGKSFALSTPLFVQPSDSAPAGTSTTFIPFNRGSSMLFGGSGGYLMQVHRRSPADTWTLQWTLKGSRDFAGLPDQTFQGTRYIPLDGAPTLDGREEKMLYAMKYSDSSLKAIYLPLPLDRLEPGLFQLKLEFSTGGETISSDFRFSVNWPNKPLSLQNFEHAVDALQHIATAEELDEMLSGSLQNRAAAFHRFWKKKDRDTTTAYNEKQAEYYRRVDESLRRYSTDSGGDGFKTDRGRISILYGMPTHVERYLQPGSRPKEVWTYDTLKRRFIFVDHTKTGNYQLTEAETL